MKPWHQSKKLWTAVITAVCAIVVAVVGDHLGKPELANTLTVAISAIGAVLIAGFAAADHGKVAESIAQGGDDES